MSQEQTGNVITAKRYVFDNLGSAASEWENKIPALAHILPAKCLPYIVLLFHAVCIGHSDKLLWTQKSIFV